MTIGMDTDIIGSTWSNMFGILLTNSFSIVGTILVLNTELLIKKKINKLKNKKMSNLKKLLIGEALM